jgi:hypothetical protein
MGRGEPRLRRDGIACRGACSCPSGETHLNPQISANCRREFPVTAPKFTD